LSKVSRKGATNQVVYDEEMWGTLRAKRETAAQILRALARTAPDAVVLGSVARGDVSNASDVDIALRGQVPSYMVETALESAGFASYKRLLVQATPMSSPRGYVFLDPAELTVVSYPLTGMTMTEHEFDRFGGCLGIGGLVGGERVPGVDKRLMLIEPTPSGHLESSILGREAEVSRTLSISLETVSERVRVLTRRDEVGRTGPIVRRELPRGQSFEKAVAEVVKRNPMLRRVIDERG